MKFYDIVYMLARDNGMTIENLSHKLGKGSKYISSSRNRGSIPQVDNAAMILKACGYTLCAVPKKRIPKNAIKIDF